MLIIAIGQIVDGLVLKNHWTPAAAQVGVGAGL